MLLEYPPFLELVFEHKELNLRLLWMLANPLSLKNPNLPPLHSLNLYSEGDIDWSKDYAGAD
jgi:hypothetical protein